MVRQNFAVLGAFVGACLLAGMISSCKTPAQQNASDTKDVGEYKGYKIFVWPEKVKLRDHRELGEQMTQYAEYVGTSLHQTPKGKAECSWTEGERDTRVSKVRAAMGDSKKYCTAVSTCYLKKGPIGPANDRSEYCQYGNCGEGGEVGACLAKTFGFEDNEIRICESKNDHCFAMVKGPRGKDWCILDRWANIANYRCGIDWDQATSGVTVDGVRTPDEWFQKVTCATLEERMKQ